MGYEHGGDYSSSQSRHRGRRSRPTGAMRALMISAQVLVVFTALAYGITVFLFARSGLVPTLLLVAAAAGTGIILAVILITLWRTRMPGHGVRLTVLAILSALALVACIVSSHAMVSLMRAANEIQPPAAGTVRYDVIALTSHSEEIDSFAGQKMGRLAPDTNAMAVAEKVAQLVDVTLADYSDAGDLAEALQDGRIQAAVINDARMSLYEENLPDFFKQIKIITFFDFVPVKPQPSPTPTPTPQSEKPFVVYISGVDTVGAVGRSDVNIIAAVNPAQGKVLLVNTPRDYYVQLHGTTGRKDKLTHAGVYGVDMSVATLADLYETDIEYYVRINFTGMVRLVDALGGIEVNSDYDFTSTHGHYHFVQGLNTMNGEQALGFARERYSFSAGDRTRGQNQQRVIEALIKKLTQPAVLLNYSSILNSLQGMLQTSVPAEKMASLVNQQLRTNVNWQVESISVDGTGASEPTYSMGSQLLYVMIPDMATVEAARAKIDAVLAE